MRHSPKTGSPLNPKKLTYLYSSGKSMKKIGEIMGCSEKKVLHWMKRYNIQRRSRSEASYTHFNPKGNPFAIKEHLSPEELSLKGLGIGIFWGEGTKNYRYSVRVTNTDPSLIRIFNMFLRKICGVPKRKIFYSIICFNDTKPEIAAHFWSKELGISPKKFGKITQIPTQGKGTYKRKSQHGVCTICVSNIKLKAWIDKELDGVRLGSLVVKQPLGKG